MTYERCGNCNQILQTTEDIHCEDCTAKMQVSQSPEARADRGGMAYALYTKGSSFAQLLGHAQILSVDADLFEAAYMAHGGIIYFNEETDAAPAIDLPETQVLGKELLPRWMIARQRDPNYAHPDPVYADTFIRGTKVWVSLGSRTVPGFVIHHLDDRKALRRVIVDYGDGRRNLPIDVTLLSARN